MQRFKLESEMQSVVREWLARRGLAVRAEVRTPWGYCDLVGCHLDEERTEQRLQLGQTAPVGSPLLFDTLHRLPEATSRRTIGFRTLVRAYAGLLSEEDVARNLDELVRSGHAVEPRPARYQKMNGWFPMHRELIAVELKLSRVAEAIGQASANLAFADESYVALPRAAAERAALDREDEFMETGVGLLAAGMDCCYMLVCSCPVARPNLTLQASVVERFWEYA